MFFIATFPLRIIAAVFEILTNWKYLKYCLVPLTLGTVFFGASYYFLVGYSDQMVETYIPLISNHIPQLEGAIRSAGSVLGILFSIIIATVVGLVGMNVVGLYFFELLLTTKMATVGLMPASPTNSSFLRSTVRGISDEITKFLFIALISVALIPLSLFPIFGIVILIIGFFLIGVELVDLPLSVLKLRFRDRWRLCRKFWYSVVTVGFWYSILIVIPLTGILFLPPVYIALTGLIQRMVAEHKEFA